MRYRFPYVGPDLRKLAFQPATSETFKTTDTGYHAICMFTSPAIAGYSFQPTHRGRTQAE